MNRPLPQTPAPPLYVPVIDGEQFVLGEQHPDTFTLIVFYRGGHCPICRGYLQQLQKALPELQALGVTTVAASADTEERARRCVEEWHLDKLPVAYAQTEDSMRQWGLYLSRGVKDPEPDLFGEPAIYLVKPDGTIHMAALNSMPAARPRIDDLLGGIKYFIDTDYPARGEASSAQPIQERRQRKMSRPRSVRRAAARGNIRCPNPNRYPSTSATSASCNPTGRNSAFPI